LQICEILFDLVLILVEDKHLIRKSEEASENSLDLTTQEFEFALIDTGSL